MVEIWKVLPAYKLLLPGSFPPAPRRLPPSHPNTQISSATEEKAAMLGCIIRQLRIHLGASLWEQDLWSATVQESSSFR